MQQNIMPVPTFKLSFQVQFFAETYFRVFKSLAEIAKIRFSPKFPLIRYVLCIGILLARHANDVMFLGCQANFGTQKNYATGTYNNSSDLLVWYP